MVIDQVKLKIITHVVRLEYLLSAATKTINIVQVEHPRISGGIRVPYGKVDVKSTKTVIYL